MAAQIHFRHRTPRAGSAELLEHRLAAGDRSLVARLADGGQPDVGNLDSGDMGGIVAVFSGVLVAEGLDEACHKILIHWTRVHGDRDVLALAEIADISLAHEPAALLWHVRVFKQRIGLAFKLCREFQARS